MRCTRRPVSAWFEMDDLPSGLGDRDRSPNFGMQWEVNDTQMRHTIRAVRRKPLTIGKLLGVAGCFAIVFATASYAENFGSWVLFFVVLPMFGGMLGTYKYGLSGFVEGASYGVLLLPLSIILLIVVLIWLFLLSVVLSPLLSAG